MANSYTTEKIREMIDEVSRSVSDAITDDNIVTEFSAAGQENALANVALPVARERDALAASLTKINAIRNSIVGKQSVNWSEHIYPLVTALNDAGYAGEGYEVARNRAEKERESVLAIVRERDKLACDLSAAHDALDLLQDDGSLGRVTWDEFTQRELTVGERISSLAQQHAAELREPHPNEVALAAELASVKAALIEWRDSDRALVITLSQYGDGTDSVPLSPTGAADVKAALERSHAATEALGILATQFSEKEQADG